MYGWTAAVGVILLLCAGVAVAQEPAEKPKEKAVAGAGEKGTEPPNAAQIELLETKYRFETNGDSRKELHALVKINTELGVRQFARLNFDYNRGFQSVEIPLVHITHSGGGTAEILPSAISDNPNPAVDNAPAYQDVRVKSIRILGLQPGDHLEYRVITTTANHPLAPEFWLNHSFDRTGVVTTEKFDLDLPASQFQSQSLREEPSDRAQVGPPSGTVAVSHLHFSRDFEPISVESIREGDTERTLAHWSIAGRLPPSEESTEPDISFSTFSSADDFSGRLARFFYPAMKEATAALQEQLDKMFRPGDTSDDKLRKVYDLVSKRIRTIDLPLGSTEFVTRDPADILSSGYAIAEDKIALLEQLCRGAHISEPHILLVSSRAAPSTIELNPSVFEHVVVSTTYGKRKIVMDPSTEVAPIGLVPASLRGKTSLLLYFPRPDVQALPFENLSYDLPFPAKQRVVVDSDVASSGTLSAKVHYTLRGENELLLRVTFHRTPKEKQLEIAQYLALADGFRGKVTSVKTSDPYLTDGPFEVEYRLTQEKFVDWTRKPVLIPALLPLPGLPEVSSKPAADKKIELGPPLEIELSGTLRLPPGATAEAPAGTSARRDYATFTSQYSAKENLVHFSRHLNFLLAEIAGARAVDLAAFLHAVQSDQSQLFLLEKPETAVPLPSHR